MDFLDALSPGDRLGPYVIVRQIGAGGMGTVYEATHSHLRRPAAVKVLSEYLVTESGRQRFEREVRAIASLHNPHTVEIYDFGETEKGTLYYAMELLDGFDLRRLVDVDGPQPPPRTIRILAQIAGALSEAHALGLVHRDIKPPNIILSAPGGEPDVAKLLDFGLVMPLTKGRRITLDGHLIGTPRYVAPEMLAKDEPIGPAADLYALGLVAYFLLSGRHAFEGDASAEILRRQRDEPPAPIGDYPGVPKDLASVVTWCLEKDPDARPASARALREAVTQCADASRWDEDEARAWWDAHGAHDVAGPTDRPEPRLDSSRPSITAPERPSRKTPEG